MAQLQHTPSLTCLEEAVTMLFCLIDDAYALLNPRARRYESLSSNFRTRKSSPSPYSSNSEGWKVSAPSCARLSGSSRICFRGWWGCCTLPRSTGG